MFKKENNPSRSQNLSEDQESKPGHIQWTRRSFLQNTCASLTLPLMFTPSFLNPFAHSGGDTVGPLKTEGHLRNVKKCAEKREKKLSFYNTHTGESVKNLVFWANDYIPENLQQLNKLFRDHRTGDIETIDKKLWELLYLLHGKLEITEPFHLISGFRSTRTNKMLCENSNGVAKHSQHTLGRAADIALPRVRSIRDIQRAAKNLRLGGVGAYSQFVHVDVGRVRYW